VAVFAVDDFFDPSNALLEMRTQGKMAERARSVDDLRNRGAPLALEEPQKTGTVLGLDIGLDLLGLGRQPVHLFQELLLPFFPGGHHFALGGLLVGTGFAALGDLLGNLGDRLLELLATGRRLFDGLGGIVDLRQR
jgi:hypothetical protein